MGTVSDQLLSLVSDTIRPCNYRSPPVPPLAVDAQSAVSGECVVLFTLLCGMREQEHARMGVNDTNPMEINFPDD